MNTFIPDGIFPTMLVAYDKNNHIDYKAMEELIEWYIAKGVDGIFALCHSTEIHCLTLKERLELGEFVLRKVAGRVSVVMSGITAYTHQEQLAEAKAIAALKPDAVVLLTNRIAYENPTDFYENIASFLKELPIDMPLGLYECPHPYKRVLTDEEVAFLAESGRFAFIKDTCCDLAMMKRRAELTKNSTLKLYNANCATFIESMRFGYSGFSGIMANFHPDLYAAAFRDINGANADFLNPYLGVTSLVELRAYPVCCKQYLARYEGLSLLPYSRSVADTNVPTVASELEGIYVLTSFCRREVGI